mgnify:CR=1 FL=1
MVSLCFFLKKEDHHTKNEKAYLYTVCTLHIIVFFASIFSHFSMHVICFRL